MKPRIPTRNNACITNLNRPPNLNTLHGRNLLSIQISDPYYTRCERGMDKTFPAHKWSVPILHFHLHPHRTGNLFFISKKKANSMDKRDSTTPINYSRSLPRIRPPMGTNIILRSHSNHQSILSNPNPRKRTSRMVVGKLLGLTTNPKPILLTTLPSTDSCGSNSTSSPNCPP